MGTPDPSDFWRTLGLEHRATLDSHGFTEVKRRQALRYFTWQWRWSQVRRSEQARFLARHAHPRDWLDAWSRPGPLDEATWDGPDWTPADRRLYVAATRLLWRYAGRHGASDVLALDEPPVGSPLPVMLDDRLISQDLANTALEIAAMRRGGARSPARIIEIGAGYGRTAHALLSLNPDAGYTIVDIEPTISISKWYLRELFPADRVRFVTPDQLDRLEDGGFDLALSISSLQEMTPEIVEGYLELLDRVVDGHVYLKQWETWHNPVDDVELTFDDYPTPGGWNQRLAERCPVQTRFLQKVWATR